MQRKQYRAVSVNPLLNIEIKLRKITLQKFHFYTKNQEFSSGYFPHIFKAIRLLEKILEPKNVFFFFFFKKSTFSVVYSQMFWNEKKWLIFDSFFKHQFYMQKTKIFKKSHFTIYIFKLIWTFLMNIKFVCSMVILYISILSISPMLQTIQNPCLESKFYRKSSFSRKKDAFLVKNTVFYPL